MKRTPASLAALQQIADSEAAEDLPLPPLRHLNPERVHTMREPASMEFLQRCAAWEDDIDHHQIATIRQMVTRYFTDIDRAITLRASEPFIRSTMSALSDVFGKNLTVHVCKENPSHAALPCVLQWRPTRGFDLRIAGFIALRSDLNDNVRGYLFAESLHRLITAFCIRLITPDVKVPAPLCLDDPNWHTHAAWALCRSHASRGLNESNSSKSFAAESPNSSKSAVALLGTIF